MKEPISLQPTAAPERRGLPIVLLLAVGAALIAAAFFGTAFYNYYIPNIAAAGDFSLGLAVIAMIGGVAAFLSPCAFGMLPAYFAFFISMRESSESGSVGGSPVRTSLRYGAATAAGLVAAGIVLAGLIWALGASFAPGLRVVTEEPHQVTRAIRIGAGALMVLLGGLYVLGRRLPHAFRFPAPWKGQIADRASDAVSRRAGSPMRWFFAYGLLYLLVALPCTANVMAAPLLFAGATAGAAAAAMTVLLFLATMAVMMLLASLLIGLSKEGLVRRFTLSAGHIQLVAAVFFIGIGLTLIYLDLNLAAFRETFFRFPIRG